MTIARFRATPEEHKAYVEDGFFIRPSVFDADEVAELRAAAERAVAGAERAMGEGLRPEDRYEIDGNVYVEAGGSTIQLEHTPGSDTIRVVEPFHHLDPRLDAMLDDPRLTEPMRDLVGADRVAVWTDKLNLKRPREGSRFRWHQDSPYWAFDCDHVDRLVNVMIALDDATVENGCLRVVRGSHHRGLLPGLEGDGKLGPLFTDPKAFDLAAQVPAEMPAGSLLFFSPHTVHGSEPNRSERARRAFVLTYQPAGERMFKVDRVRDAGPDGPAPPHA